jgi:hypothetical protein
MTQAHISAAVRSIMHLFSCGHGFYLHSTQYIHCRRASV